MKKILIIMLSLILLVGCSSNSTKLSESQAQSQNLFKQEIKDITLAEMKANNVPDEMSEEFIEAIINPMIEQSGILVTNKFYSEPSSAMIKNGSEVTGGSKLGLSLKAEADEEAMSKFLVSLAGIKNKFTLVSLDVNKSVDNYKFEMEIVFYSHKSIAEISSDSNFGTITKVETYKEEDTKVVLRDNDFFGSVRSATSDISAVRFSKNNGNDTSKLVSKDRNQVEDVNLELTKEGKKYYFRYYIDDEMYPRNNQKEEFKPKGEDILIDILSSDRIRGEDLVGMNLIIKNNTDKKVDLKVFEDDDKRVRITYI